MLILLGFVVSLLVWSLTPADYGFPASVSDRFHFADWINQAEHWLQLHVKQFTRSVAEVVGWCLEQLELFLWFQPWPTITLAIVLPALVYGGLRLAIFTLAGVLFWGVMGMWDAAMSTLALMGVSVAISVVIGIAVGVLASQSDGFEAFVKPILDTMQTMPAFVYLIPAIFFFGIGGPSATLAIIIYAMPPVVRLTSLGIRQVPATTIEAAQSFGSTPSQVLWKVQIPQALPSIMLGINQTIMMALGLAVLSTFIGAGGLGEEVWKALRKLRVGWSLEAGLSIVFMAIIFDRLSLAMSRPAESGMMVDPSKMTFRLLPRQWVHWPPAQIAERGIDTIWQIFARSGNLVVAYVSLALGSILGMVHRNLAAAVVAWMRRHSFFVAGFLLILAIIAWDAWIMGIGSFPRAWKITLRGPVDEAIDWLTVNATFIGFTTGLRAFIYFYILNPLDKFFTGL
ncbi:MAG: ABC transporter permease subunit, partial [Alphaproteobacteria bacterium]|nr:ABC transporter permease subunit [Alphaproteobacteria bacterium]